MIGFAKVTRDATERRNLESQLERSNDELQRFAYTVSHDLQEPLRTVRSYAELLSAPVLRETGCRRRRIYPLHDGCGGAYDSAFEGSAGIFSGWPARSYRARTDFFGKYSSVGDHERRSAGERERRTITYDPLPMVEADQTQLSQVFQNLLINAIKYRTAVPPALHISAVRVNDMYEFSVRRQRDWYRC